MDQTSLVINFAALVAAGFLEAAPFLAAGAFVSALVEVFVSEERAGRLAPRGPIAGALAGMAAGLVLPICECGVVPVARRFLLKGVPPPAVFGYMLAAPVVNPVVLVSTYVAFRGDWFMLLSRVGIVALTAFTIASSLSKVPARALLNPNQALPEDHGHDHGHDHCCHVHGHSESRWRQVLRHTISEFLGMGRFLILGIAAAAAFKTFTPMSAVLFLQQGLPLSVAAMMLLAIVLSVCSEVDAFVAASFNPFPPAAQLAFTAIGPMIDLKLIAMYAVVFERRVFLMLMIVPTIIVYVMTLALFPAG